jgi:DNA-3-methyladenine glycosylase
MGLRLIDREFFGRPALGVAPELLGCVLSHATPEGTVSVRLTEVEAYAGTVDPASHAFRGRTRRNAVMFGPPGHAYVYFTYGMHFCANLVCLPEGTAEAVLLRAGEVVDGEALARVRRPKGDLARGPARLCQALGIDRRLDGADVCTFGGPLMLSAGTAAGIVRSGPRVGVSAGATEPWRYWLDGEASVSVYRAHKNTKRH